MEFNVGIVELYCVGVLLAVVAILAVLRLRAWRWAMIGIQCVIVGAVMTPADLASTLILGTMFLLFFIGGRQFGIRTAIAA